MTNMCFKCNVLLTTIYVTGWHFPLMPIIPTFEFFTQLLKVIWNHNNNILQSVNSNTAYTGKNLRNMLTWITSRFLHLTSQDKILDKCQRNYIAVHYWWSIGWQPVLESNNDEKAILQRPQMCCHCMRVWKVLAMTSSIKKTGKRQTARNKSYII